MSTHTIHLTDPVPPAAGSSSLMHMIQAACQRPQGRVLLAGTFGCLGLLAVVFWPTLQHFAFVWSTDENYSHGFLVPLISLYFANEAARRGPTIVRGGVALGVVLLGLSLLGRLATTLVPVGIVADGAFLIGLAGLCCLLFGTEALRRYWFALFFLAFMVPLPVALYARIASPLQLMASQVASGVLGAIGIPVLREGNLMTLPGDLRMFVAEACSGIRQLTGFLALTTAVAYLTVRPFWYRAVVVASSVPIALTANVVRVTLTGVIMYHVDPRYASGTFHTLEGLLMMGLGLAMLGAECWLLNRVSGRPSSTIQRLPVGLIDRPSTLQQA
jgi:exosortase